MDFDKTMESLGEMGCDVLAFKFGGREEWEKLGRTIWQGGRCSRDTFGCPDCAGTGSKKDPVSHDQANLKAMGDGFRSAWKSKPTSPTGSSGDKCKACDGSGKCKVPLDCMEAEQTGDGKCSVCGADWSNGWDALGKSSGDLLLAAAAHQCGANKADIVDCMLALDNLSSCRDMDSLKAAFGVAGTLGAKMATSTAKGYAINYLGSAITKELTNYLGNDLKVSLNLHAGKVGGLLDMAGLPKTLEFDLVEKIKRYGMAKCREKLGLGFTENSTLLLEKAQEFTADLTARRRMHGLSCLSSRCYMGRREHFGRRLAENSSPRFAALVLAIKEQGFEFRYD